MNIDKEVTKKMRSVLEGVGFDGVEEMQRTVAVKTGELKRSIKHSVNNDGLVLNFSMRDYGKYVEYGTPPHIIRPKNKKALAFKMGGEDIIVKEVHHPGTRPQPFIRPFFNTKLGQSIVKNLKKEFS